MATVHEMDHPLIKHKLCLLYTSPKRKGNRRCPFLFAPAAGAALSRAPQSALPLRFSGKLSARQGEPACGSSCSPVIRCRKKEPSGRLPSPRASSKIPS